MQYTVKKPINNNILRVVDPTGCELIVTGRGLGFGVKPGYSPTPSCWSCSPTAAPAPASTAAATANKHCAGAVQAV